MMARVIPGIPEPSLTIASHQIVILALKEAVEILAKQRDPKQIPHAAVTWQDLVDLGLVGPEQVPRK